MLTWCSTTPTAGRTMAPSWLSPVKVSCTAVLDRHQASRSFSDPEAATRDRFDMGRSDRVALIFDRRTTKTAHEAFTTKIISRGVDPHLCYLPLGPDEAVLQGAPGWALRTETVISDTKDFDSAGGSTPPTGASPRPRPPTPPGGRPRRAARSRADRRAMSRLVLRPPPDTWSLIGSFDGTAVRMSDFLLGSLALRIVSRSCARRGT